MGLLEGDELSAFEARLATEPDLLAEVHAWNERFAHMVNDVAEMPPGRIKHDLQRRLFDEPLANRSFKRYRASCIEARIRPLGLQQNLY